jgi:hypothetical protein
MLAMLSLSLSHTVPLPLHSAGGGEGSGKSRNRVMLRSQRGPSQQIFRRIDCEQVWVARTMCVSNTEMWPGDWVPRFSIGTYSYLYVFHIPAGQGGGCTIKAAHGS